MHPTLIRVSRPYLTPGELDQIQRRVGLTGINGTVKRTQGFQLAWATCRALSLPARACSTAVLMYQRMLLCPSLNEPDLTIIIAACILVANKVEDTPKKVRAITAACLRVRDPAVASAEIDAITNKVLDFEQQVLESDRFDFRMRSPHLYVVKIAHELNVEKEVAATAWAIAWDMYCTVAPLKQPSHSLALAAIMLSSKIHLYEIPKFDTLDLGSRRSDVNEIMLDVLDFYITNYADALLPRNAPPRTSIGVLADILEATKKEYGGSKAGPKGKIEIDANDNEVDLTDGTARYLLELDTEYLAGEVSV